MTPQATYQFDLDQDVLAYQGPVIYTARIIGIFDPNFPMNNGIRYGEKLAQKVEHILLKNSKRSRSISSLVPKLPSKKFEKLYLVHYLGWNSSHDEWVKVSRLLPNTPFMRALQETNNNKLKVAAHGQPIRESQDMQPIQVSPPNSNSNSNAANRKKRRSSKSSQSTFNRKNYSKMSSMSVDSDQEDFDLQMYMKRSTNDSLSMSMNQSISLQSSPNVPQLMSRKKATFLSKSLPQTNGSVSVHEKKPLWSSRNQRDSSSQPPLHAPPTYNQPKSFQVYQNSMDVDKALSKVAVVSSLTQSANLHSLHVIPHVPKSAYPIQRWYLHRHLYHLSFGFRHTSPTSPAGGCSAAAAYTLAKDMDFFGITDLSNPPPVVQLTQNPNLYYPSVPKKRPALPPDLIQEDSFSSSFLSSRDSVSRVSNSSYLSNTTNTSMNSFVSVESSSKQRNDTSKTLSSIDQKAFSKNQLLLLDRLGLGDSLPSQKFHINATNYIQQLERVTQNYKTNNTQEFGHRLLYNQALFLQNTITYLSTEVQVPFSLLQQLSKDQYSVKRKNCLVPVPRAPNVSFILQDFLSLYGTDDDSNFINPHNITSLMDSFSHLLPTFLLYPEERVQYAHVHFSFQQNEKSLCDIYGAEHLLRFCIQIPQLIPFCNLTSKRAHELICVINLLLNFLAHNQSVLFINTYLSASRGTSYM